MSECYIASMTEINCVAVFCGSGVGKDPIYASAAFGTGQCLALNKIELIYGGAGIGLMGQVANGALQSGGMVIGVIPHFMDQREVIHTGITELVCVESMHERKLKMYERADGIIALPGGFGTMDELFEVLTWVQLGLHAKPVGILNVNGYYDALLSMMATMVEDGFLRAEDLERICVSNDIYELLEQMRSADLAKIVPVIDRRRT